jgi:starvation-inducible DNA-binding protein
LEILEKRQEKITNNNDDLGFSKLEKAEVVTGLNLTLADLEVHYQKLRNFHWNVTGPDFFDLHEKFEELYNETKIRIDEVAERIRIFSARPYISFQEFLTNSTIKEINKDMTGMEMVHEILNDFEILINDMTQVVTIARKTGDIGTEDLMIKYIREIEKHHWMLKSFVTPQ